MSGSEIDDGGRNKERRNLARTALHQFPVFALDDVKPADAGRNVNADFVEVRVFFLPACRLHGKIRGGQRHLDEAAHLLQFFFLDPLEWVENLDFTGDFAIEAIGIELSDQPNATLTGDEIFPRFLRADSQRADQSNTRDYHSASQLSNAPC